MMTGQRPCGDRATARDTHAPETDETKKNPSPEPPVVVQLCLCLDFRHPAFETWREAHGVLCLQHTSLVTTAYGPSDCSHVLGKNHGADRLTVQGSCGHTGSRGPGDWGLKLALLWGGRQGLGAHHLQARRTWEAPWLPGAEGVTVCLGTPHSCLQATDGCPLNDLNILLR